MKNIPVNRQLRWNTPDTTISFMFTPDGKDCMITVGIAKNYWEFTKRERLGIKWVLENHLSGYWAMVVERDFTKMYNKLFYAKAIIEDRTTIDQY